MPLRYSSFNIMATMVFHYYFFTAGQLYRFLFTQKIYLLELIKG